MSVLPPDIVLVAVNARYSHASLGARFLLANVDDALRARTVLLEFSINDPVEAIAENIAGVQPRLVGLGVYIWNRGLVETLVPLLRQKLPAAVIVLGGPEIAHDTASALAHAADCVVRGEGERLWPAICRDVLDGRPLQPLPPPLPPVLETLQLPDTLYADSDLRHRNIYIEASRGCPLACAFCLSSAQPGVRHFPEAAVHASLQRLLDRGALQFRFVDRSFNLGGERSLRLLGFFLERLRPGLRLHFELTPDGLSPALRALLIRFPPGVLHLEAGIQSFDPAVLARVNRRCDLAAAAEGIAWLVREARADVHADLIAGLPGETLAGFEAGFDRLYRLGPSEIQVGILKRLHGTALSRDAQGARFRDVPPYDVLETPGMTADELDGVRRFASHWDRVVNRGHFPGSLARLLRDEPSPWQCFDAFSRRLEPQYGLYGMGLVELASALLDVMTATGIDHDEARALLRADYLDKGRRQNLPAFLR
jgi:radical SAM superfamily enzyme YgiQ (UPF0313 family)